MTVPGAITSSAAISVFEAPVAATARICCSRLVRRVRPSTPLVVQEHEAVEERPHDVECEAVLNGEVTRASRAADVDGPAGRHVDPDAERRLDAERLEEFAVELQPAERAAREEVRQP